MYSLSFIFYLQLEKMLYTKVTYAFNRIFLLRKGFGMKKAIILKRLITETGLSVREFSKQAGIPHTTLRSILERGVGNAAIDNIIKICKALGITVDALEEMSLCDGEDDMACIEAIKNSNNSHGYYLNPEVSHLAQEIYENPDLRLLFDTTRKVDPEDLKLISKMVSKMVKEENGGED